MSTDGDRTVRVKDIVGVARACQILNRSPATIQVWRNRPQMKFPKPLGRIGNRDYFDVNEILQWIAERPELQR